jgi:hypothetical protein
MQSRFIDAMQLTVSNDLETIEAAKERFYDRVLLDPDDLNLTAAERTEPLTPYMLSKRRTKPTRAYETQEIANFPCCAGLFEGNFLFASVRAFH